MHNIRFRSETNWKISLQPYICFGVPLSCAQIWRSWALLLLDLGTQTPCLRESSSSKWLLWNVLSPLLVLALFLPLESCLSLCAHGIDHMSWSSCMYGVILGLFSDPSSRRGAWWADCCCCWLARYFLCRIMWNWAVEVMLTCWFGVIHTYFGYRSNLGL